MNLQINSPEHLIQWYLTSEKAKHTYEDKQCLVTFKFKFASEQLGLTNFTRDFVEKVISVGLKQLYGIVGMGKFNIKLVEAFDFTVKVQMNAKYRFIVYQVRLLCQFWSALFFTNKINNIDFRVYFIEALISDEIET